MVAEKPNEAADLVLRQGGLAIEFAACCTL